MVAVGLITWLDPSKVLSVTYQGSSRAHHGGEPMLLRSEVGRVGNMSMLTVDITESAAVSAVRRELEALSFHDLVLVGVFSRQQDYVRRSIYRSTTSHLLVAGVDQRFVVCANASNPLTDAVRAEILYHEDIVVLDCLENMDNGKSFDYFRVIRQLYPDYRFYAKADLDTFILYHNLAFVLASSPDCHFYLGCMLWWGHLSFGYANGAMYVISSDLVIDLERCGANCTDVAGPEDQEIGRALDQLTHDSLQWGDICDHAVMHFPVRPDQADFAQLHESMVYIHGVKDPEIWWNVYKHYVSLLAVGPVTPLPLEQYLSVPPHPSFIWDPQCQGLIRPKEP